MRNTNRPTILAAFALAGAAGAASAAAINEMPINQIEQIEQIKPSTQLDGLIASSDTFIADAADPITIDEGVLSHTPISFSQIDVVVDDLKGSTLALCDFSVHLPGLDLSNAQDALSDGAFLNSLQKPDEQPIGLASLALIALGGLALKPEKLTLRRTASVSAKSSKALGWCFARAVKAVVLSSGIVVQEATTGQSGKPVDNAQIRSEVEKPVARVQPLSPDDLQVPTPIAA